MDLPRSLRIPSGLDLAKRSELEWIANVTECLDHGALWRAHDLISAGIAQYPGSGALLTLAARVLVRADSLDEAQQLLEQIVPDPIKAEHQLQKVWQGLTRLGSAASATPTADDLTDLARLIRDFDVARSYVDEGYDKEALGMLARVHKSLWVRDGSIDDRDVAIELYNRGFVKFADFWLGINAATLFLLAGRVEVAQDLAAKVLTLCDAHRMDDPFWLHATRGEALLVLGRLEDSVQAYADAARFVNGRFAFVASARQQLKLFASHGVDVPAAIWESLKPPAVVAFAGRRLDEPGAAEIFPLAKLNHARDQISEILQRIDARVGFCSAACGSDLLFIEAMLDRDAEVNIALPFNLADFRDRCVAYAGPNWVRRFDRALKLAHSVQLITDEPMLGDHSLFPLLSRAIAGLTSIHADRLEAQAQLVLVRGKGMPVESDGVEELANLWPDAWPRHEVEIKSATAAKRKPAADEHEGRQIHSFLFCDVVGYSKLQEAHQPTFLHGFLRRVATTIQHPEFVNTAGDGLFVATKDSLTLANYALDLQYLIATTHWAELDLPPHLTMRFALHAGPAFEMEDPFTGKPNLYGSHVNRAARMEPVTIPGQIYASEQFVALLVSDLLSKGYQDPKEFPVHFTYLGPLDLAKSFGMQRVYRLYRPALRALDATSSR